VQAFRLGKLSNMRKYLRQHFPNRRKINAMVPVGIGPVGEGSNNHDNNNALISASPRAVLKSQHCHWLFDFLDSKNGRSAKEAASSLHRHAEFQI
jgi:hypothetical protein